MDVVVDLSNASPDKQLSLSDWPASWSRLQRLLAWWSRHCGAEAQSALFVADANLHGLMDRQDQVEFATARRSNSLVVAGDADAMTTRACSDVEGPAPHLRPTRRPRPKHGAVHARGVPVVVSGAEVSFGPQGLKRLLGLGRDLPEFKTR